MICRCVRNISGATLIAALGLFFAPVARADGYYYAPKSFYVVPPLVYDYYPLFRAAPIVVYEPVRVAPPPIAGYYYRLPAQPIRVRESGNASPSRSRYRYEERYPNGVEYKYRYKRDGGYIRFTEKWEG